MQFIVVFHPKDEVRTKGLPPDFAQVEQVQARALYKSGGIRQIWALKRERRGAVGLFEAASQEELQSMVASFPMVQKDYADHEVFPLGPFGAFRRMIFTVFKRACVRQQGAGHAGLLQAVSP